MTILGLNAFHGDSSAALVINGQLIAAVEEERFNRVKHWAGFPAQSIRYCLQQAGLTLRDIDHVALSFDPKANLGKKALFAIANRPSLSSIIDRLTRQSKSLSIKAQLATACDVGEDQIRAQFHNIEHHDAHIASGFFTGPFEEAAILSIDGMGDFVSTVLARGKSEIGNAQKLKFGKTESRNPIPGSSEISTFNFQLSTFKKLSEVFYPHSLGFLYNVITLYLGFHNYGDEYKVMGLAPYGQPTYLDEFRKIIYPKGDLFELNLDYFRHHKDGVSMSWDNGAPKVEPFHSELLEKRLGPALQPRAEMGDREANIAASVQRVTEEIIFHLLNRLHALAPSDNVILVGGCAMNSVANGKVTRNTPFKNAWIPAGAADNGTSFGAAFAVWEEVKKAEIKKAESGNAERLKLGKAESKNPNPETSEISNFNSQLSTLPPAPPAPSEISAFNFPLSTLPSAPSEISTFNFQLSAFSRFHLTHASWGPSFTTAQCRAAAAKFPVTVQEMPDDALYTRIVDAMIDGKVIGWFQGRMEFGARALGCRSLVADPRRADMRDIINLKIKFREKFRPFAPSILAEAVADWFDIDEASPFMEKVLPIRKDKQALIPAVTHVDGSGRLQTVTRETNPRYYDLIKKFGERTGVPIILNTSLNENEPIVHTPEQAIDCFLRTSMDAIVLEALFITRR